VRSSGSFYANPIIPATQAAQLLARYPQMPHWPTAEGDVKVAAAWLIEQVGFKGLHDPETGMATWPVQPLVVVNERARSTADLIRFRQKNQDAVRRQFGITLVREPDLLP
jgi:UDP-N-acetylmuramate dehydrogenase